jgi:hypothetical protein
VATPVAVLFALIYGSCLGRASAREEYRDHSFTELRALRRTSGPLVVSDLGPGAAVQQQEKERSSEYTSRQTGAF